MDILLSTSFRFWLSYVGHLAHVPDECAAHDYDVYTAYVVAVSLTRNVQSPKGTPQKSPLKLQTEKHRISLARDPPPWKRSLEDSRRILAVEFCYTMMVSVMMMVTMIVTVIMCR